MYYKDRYILALYSGGPLNDEYLDFVGDNVDEISDFLGRKRNNVASVVSQIYNKKTHNAIKGNKKKYTLHFIDMKDENNELEKLPD